MSIRLLKRWLLTALAALLLLVLLIAAVLQYTLFAEINRYKPRITQALSQALNQDVSIESLSIHWQGLTPEVSLHQLVLFDAQHRPALQLTNVDAALSWSSVLLLSPTLSKLHIDAPDLVIRRNPKGELFLAGISLAGNGNPAFANWLIAQRSIQITHAKVQWIDELRAAPTLTLHDVNLDLETPVWHRLLKRHSLHADSLITKNGSQRMTLDAMLVGADLAAPNAWHGDASIRLPQTKLAAWQPWFDLPMLLHRGEGSLNARLRFANSHIEQLQSRLDVQNLSVTPKNHTRTFEAGFLRGTIEWKHQPEGGELRLQKVSTDIEPGLSLQDANGTLRWQGENLQISLNAEKIALNNSAALSDWLPSDSALSSYVQGMAPQGIASKVKLKIERKQQVWGDYEAEADFDNLSSRAYEKIPGIQHWRGHLSVKPNQGSLALNTENASLDTAGLLRWPIPITKLQGTILWQHNGNKTLISTRSLKLDNPHLGLVLDLEYLINPQDGDSIQMQAHLAQVHAKYASYYYPNILGAPTIHWLDTSILDGTLHHAQVIVRGKVKDFPFVNQHQQADPKIGLFRVTAQAEHLLMEYGTDWPKIIDLGAHMKFEGKRMDIEASSGTTGGHQISHVHADIPVLDADDPILNVHALGKAGIDQGIKFINSSPVHDVVMGFTDNLKASGNAELQLDLQIPLQNVEAARFHGDYLIKNGHLDADANLGLPKLDKLNGHIKFSEKGLSIQNMQAELFEGPATFNVSTRADKAITIQGNGHISENGIRALDDNLLTAALRGSTDWKANVFIQKPRFQLDIRSQLQGISSVLPAPLNKTADTAANLFISIKQDNAQQDNVEVHYDDWVHAKFIRQHEAQLTRIQGGEIAVNTPLVAPTGDGIHLQAIFSKLNIDEWTDYLKNNASHESTTNHPALAIRNIDVKADVLQVFDRSLHQIKLHITPESDKLKLNIQGQELAGDADWLQGKQNKLIAKLNYLRIPRNKPSTETKPPVEIRRLSNAYPELEIAAQEFQFGDKNLGALDLKANNSGDNWVIQRMTLTNPDSQLIADGVWRNTLHAPNTQIKFVLNSSNLGQTLQRFQPGELVNGGSGTMSGHIDWPGSPHEFAIEQLDGNFKLQLEKGQILKVQPGVGRLLGLLSLQSLPRRLTLDFRDLFSEGFAFDKIQCSANMNDGILRSQDFFMTGPAAEAKIKGETNLKTETQLLKVKVTPHVSDTLSLAALAGGPVVGVAAFVAQKLLKDPLNKISASEYTIGGTWDNPQEMDNDKANQSSTTPKK